MKQKQKKQKRKMTSLSPPQALDLSAGGNTSTNWKKFKKAWNNYEVATGLIEKPSNVRLATFLHVIGEAGVEKYESFEFENDDGNKIEKVIEKFEEDCKPRTNILNERYNFLKRKQEDGESIDQYTTQLKLLAASCEYQNANEAVRDQLVLNMKDDEACEKVLDKAQFEGKVPDLDQLIGMIKNYESRKAQRKCWRSAAEDVNYIKRHKEANHKNESGSGRK